jgi:hypothetical protein
MTLLIGFGLVALLGIFHHFALQEVRRMTADTKECQNRAIIPVLVGFSLFIWRRSCCARAPGACFWIGHGQVS